MPPKFGFLSQNFSSSSGSGTTSDAAAQQQLAALPAMYSPVFRDCPDIVNEVTMLWQQAQQLQQNQQPQQEIQEKIERIELLIRACLDLLILQKNTSIGYER